MPLENLKSLKIRAVYAIYIVLGRTPAVKEASELRLMMLIQETALNDGNIDWTGVWVPRSPKISSNMTSFFAQDAVSPLYCYIGNSGLNVAHRIFIQPWFTSVTYTLQHPVFLVSLQYCPEFGG